MKRTLANLSELFCHQNKVLKRIHMNIPTNDIDQTETFGMIGAGGIRQDEIKTTIHIAPPLIDDKRVITVVTKIDSICDLGHYDAPGSFRPAFVPIRREVTGTTVKIEGYYRDDYGTPFEDTLTDPEDVDAMLQRLRLRANEHHSLLQREKEPENQKVALQNPYLDLAMI